MGWLYLYTIVVASVLATSAQVISNDGNCGSRSSSNATCLGSADGDCCSTNSYCGNTTGYCGAGCQPDFGSCYVNSSVISADSRCGDQGDGQICLGSSFGDCCSSNGYCGSNDTYCGTDCQSAFGNCQQLPISSSATSSATSAGESSASTATSDQEAVNKTTDTVGFKVGMAIMAIGIVAILSVLAFFFVRRRRRTETRQKPLPPTPSAATLEKGSHEGAADEGVIKPSASTLMAAQELHSRPVEEMSTEYNQPRDEKKPLHIGPHELQ